MGRAIGGRPRLGLGAAGRAILAGPGGCGQGDLGEARGRLPGGLAGPAGGRYGLGEREGGLAGLRQFRALRGRAGPTGLKAI
jgi:hypothetical protein